MLILLIPSVIWLLSVKFFSNCTRRLKCCCYSVWFIKHAYLFLACFSGDRYKVKLYYNVIIKLYISCISPLRPCVQYVHILKWMLWIFLLSTSSPFFASQALPHITYSRTYSRCGFVCLLVFCLLFFSYFNSRLTWTIKACTQMHSEHCVEYQWNNNKEKQIWNIYYFAVKSYLDARVLEIILFFLH